ncbi:hypothetical protein [Microbacterium sp.]|uniref:hypothetical protein n=1 Tax=Microbacterium sp. TaxID=51671 RepID=UPI003C24CF4C
MLQQGDEISARWRWEEAARLGNVQAVTGLGMIKFDGDDVEGARADWKRAADAGDVPAEIFLQLTDEHWTATTYTYEQAATAYLDVVCGRGANAFIRFRDIAEGLEHQAYADELHARVVARQAAEANSFWPGQMNRRSV